jgi:hypothetical protein
MYFHLSAKFPVAITKILTCLGAAELVNQEEMLAGEAAKLKHNFQARNISMR